MDKALIPNYMANILAVARSNNIIGDAQRTCIDKICSDIGGKKADMKAAEKLAESAEFTPKPVGRLSDKVSNIEDMIYVALADGDLEEAEIDAIIPFINLVGLGQDIVDLMVAEGQARVAAQEATSICPSCGATAGGDAKFCPACGTSIAALSNSAESVQVEFNYPSHGISVEFAESTSANFAAALAIAKTAPDFQVCEKSRKQWHLATWPQEQITDVLSLADALKGLRNRKAYLDGEVMQWDEVFGFNWCFQRRQQAYRPNEYCFGLDEDRLNIWGCRQASMDWTSWADWLGYGKFTSKDVFVFDKDRIRHELETNLYRVRFCPCLRTNLVATVLEFLPDQVKMGERTGWQYKKEYEQGPLSIRVVQKEVQGGLVFKDEFWASGVSPRGIEVAVDILKRAFKECGIKDISPKMLTGA